jgi:putative endonuclease
MTSQHVANRRGLGVHGENLAARHLVGIGMTIVDRNVRLAPGEIDLVAQDADETVFVEVKTRVGDAETAPDTAVTNAKLARLERLAEAYLQRAGTPEVPWRVDVVAIVLGRDGRLVHLEHLRGAYL